MSSLLFFNHVSLALVVILFCGKMCLAIELPYRYPPSWQCYEGFGKADQNGEGADARGWMDHQAERICAKDNPNVCQQQCFFERLKIVNSDGPGLVSKEKMIAEWTEKIFYDGDNSAAILIADKIHKQCGELAKTVSPLANTTIFCEGENLWMFLNCVEQAWKCEMDKIPEGYPPNFGCHKGFGIPYSPYCFYECQNAPYMVRAGVSTCAEQSQHDKFCLKHCVLAEYKILDLGKRGLRPKEEIVKGLKDLFFHDGDDSSAVKIAEKIHAECGELGKNIPTVGETTRSCDGLQEFHVCVENAWKCEGDARSDELATVPKGYPPPWECHKSFGVQKPGCEESCGPGWDASYFLESVARICAVKMKDKCFKHCFMGEINIVQNDELTGLVPEEQMGGSLSNNIFFGAEDSTGEMIAKKIYEECGDLGKNVAGVENTTASCDGLAEFHACVENAWKC